MMTIIMVVVVMVMMVMMMVVIAMMMVMMVVMIGQMLGQPATQPRSGQKYWQIASVCQDILSLRCARRVFVPEVRPGVELDYHYWYVHQAFLSVNISTSDSIIRASSEYKLPIRKIIEYSLLITSVQFQKTSRPTSLLWIIRWSPVPRAPNQRTWSFQYSGPLTVAELC